MIQRHEDRYFAIGKERSDLPKAESRQGSTNHLSRRQENRLSTRNASGRFIEERTALSIPNLLLVSTEREYDSIEVLRQEPSNQDPRRHGGYLSNPYGFPLSIGKRTAHSIFSPSPISKIEPNPSRDTRSTPKPRCHDYWLEVQQLLQLEEKGYY